MKRTAAALVVVSALLVGCPASNDGFASCTAAASASATPLHDGDPGWNPELDRDGDGVACE